MQKASDTSFAVLLSFAALALASLAFLPLLQVQLMPSRGLPSLSVDYFWHGAGPEVLETEVSSKLEAVLAGVAGLQDISSTSEHGYGFLQLDFKAETDMAAARFEVANRIRQIYEHLPQGLSYPRIEQAAASGQRQTLLSYNINAPATPGTMQAEIQRIIGRQLNGEPGLDGWQLYGAMPNEWVIHYDANQLAALQVSLSELQLALRNYFGRHQLGQVLVQYPTGSSPTQVALVAKQTEDIEWATIPVKVSHGRLIYLGELIDQVLLQEKAPMAYFRINGLNTVNLVIYAHNKSNILDLAPRLHSTIQRLAKQLPAGYSLQRSYDASHDLRKELNKNIYRATLSLLILLALMVASTRRWRYLVLIGLSLVVNLAIAIGLYHAMGVEIQLYSLAGITISFGMLIDNSILMIDHLAKTGKRDVFRSLLAATLTTIGALSIVFFLEKKQQVALLDFAYVIIINLGISLGVALFFIPALMRRFPLVPAGDTRPASAFRRRLLGGYGSFIRHGMRVRWLVILFFVWAFGFPMHLLPEELAPEHWAARWYNASIGTEWYQRNLKAELEKWLGGTLSLFARSVYETARQGSPQRTALHIRAAMPEGCTLEQMNELMQNMENFLSSFSEIESYQTQVRAYNNAEIVVHFKPAFERTGFPYVLKFRASSKAISWGGADWSIYGVGQAFDNSIHTDFVNQHIIVQGYNYPDLLRYARLLQERIQGNSRVQQSSIESRIHWLSEAVAQYHVQFDFQAMARLGQSPITFYLALREKLYRSPVAQVVHQGQLTDVVLQSAQSSHFDLWHLQHQPLRIGSQQARFGQLAHIVQRRSAIPIRKENQQYSLVVSYNFAGPEKLAERFRKQHVASINQLLPLGYRAKEPDWQFWSIDSPKQYHLIGVVLLIIFFISSILFESIRQALAIVALIPISFIGVFGTFYYLDVRFDQGGYASFVLLAGLTVNAGIYLIAERQRLLAHSHTPIPPLVTYLQAFNNKIGVIFLTILSTVLGLLPFIIDGSGEFFWMSFAVGTIGGLVFSLLGILVVLPLMVLPQAKP